MKKAELYKSIIDIQKKCGQGLSGIVKAMGAKSREISESMDELIEEGLIKACRTGGSIGHPESNIFYMPVTGYNVWEDEGTDGEYQRHKGRYLHYVRFYLGALQEEEGSNDIQRALNPTHAALVKNSEFIKGYSEWLERNKEELEIMDNLSNVYIPKDITFTKKEIEYIQSKDWYKNNANIEECLKLSNERVGELKEMISINNKLLGLYEKTRHAEEIKKSKADIEDAENQIKFRKILHSYMSTKDVTSPIQELEFAEA